jgi:glycerol-3-phosphate dehydrogenase
MELLSTHYDLAIIGGGINGTGIAADAAGRGLKVMLCEQNDLASGTSSASSKLIHGGLRYLEHYEFRLVREALREREVMLGKAPHLVSPLKFTLPHRSHLRPAWLIRCGLFLYDLLGWGKNRSLPNAHSVTFKQDSPLRESIKKGFEYYDCWVDDARLVVCNALDAARHGANVQVRTQCVAARYDTEKSCWQLTMHNKLLDQHYDITAGSIINASGPWLNTFIENSVENVSPTRGIRLIKGSHIIVPRTLKTSTAYILQNEDKRIVFVMPYLDDYTLIGTTDKEYIGAAEDVSIDDWEVDYLLNIYNQHFKHTLRQEDIVSTYSGIRPLCDDESDDPSAITRDYTLDVSEYGQKNALLSIYGGKITTYRKLAEAALNILKPYLPEHAGEWTQHSPLPGADCPKQGLEDIQATISKTAPWLDSSSLRRFSTSYGLLCLEFLSGLNCPSELGEDFGAGLRQVEVDYLIHKEWACSAEDILWRRTKLGLKFTKEQVDALDVHVALITMKARKNKTAKTPLRIVP